MSDDWGDYEYEGTPPRSASFSPGDQDRLESEWRKIAREEEDLHRRVERRMRASKNSTPRYHWLDRRCPCKACRAYDEAHPFTYPEDAPRNTPNILTREVTGVPSYRNAPKGHR